jgi:prepilin-type N-terminal cleavage/methylation domain-containing protein
LFFAGFAMCTTTIEIRATSSRPRDLSRNAFSMVELVIVVMIMSIMAAVAAPAFFESLLYHRVESAAHRLKADIDLARHTARLKSTAQTITFAAGTYTFSAGVKGFDSPNGVYSVALGNPPYELNSVTANFGGTNVVSFDGYGKPASGGTVVLALQGHQCTVTVNDTTGDVTITSLHTRGNAPQYGN